jgi:hypothetical protein
MSYLKDIPTELSSVVDLMVELDSSHLCKVVFENDSNNSQKQYDCMNYTNGIMKQGLKAVVES